MRKTNHFNKKNIPLATVLFKITELNKTYLQAIDISSIYDVKIKKIEKN